MSLICVPLLAGSAPPEADPRAYETGRDAARALIRDYAVGTGEDLGYQGLDAELANLPGEYAPPEGGLHVWWNGDVGVAVGAFRSLPSIPGACEIKRMYVAPEARGQNLGARVLEALLREAKAAGYERAYLDTVARMAAAIRLYERAGFRPVPPYTANPFADALYYARDLI